MPDYSFEGSITSLPGVSASFSLKNGHLILDVLSPIDYVPLYLKGLTKDKRIVVIHLASLYVDDRYDNLANYNSRRYRGTVSSCLSLNRDSDVNRIAFGPLVTRAVTECSFTGGIPIGLLNVPADGWLLAQYTEENETYFLKRDFDSRERFYGNQIIAVDAGKTFSQEMMENVYWTMKALFSFAFQNKGAPIDDVLLFKDGTVVGHMFVENHTNNRDAFFGAKRMFVIDWGRDYLSAFLQAVSDKQIYLRHLPTSEEERRYYTVGRFLLSAIGLENVLNANGIHAEHSDTHKRAIDEIKSELQIMCNKASGKKKDKLKSLISRCDDEPLESRIIVALRDNKRYIENFFPLRFVGQNDGEIANSIQHARNKFAHGVLDETLGIKHAMLCDFLGLFILYMQLIYIGYSKEEASKQVPLFCLSFIGENPPIGISVYQ